jgi:hypothetical protein
MKVVPYRLCVCCLFAGSIALASGGTQPSPLPFEDLEWSAQVHRKPATGLTMGRLTVVFEKTFLSDVLQEAGGVITESGDAADHTLWLCYTIVDTKHPERIWLTSNGEMDRPAHAISGVIARNVAEGSTTDCPALPAALRSVSLSNGIWLGIPELRLVARFGVQPGIRDRWHGYLYAGKRRGECKPDDSDVLNSIEWTATGGVVDLIMAPRKGNGRRPGGDSESRL